MSKSPVAFITGTSSGFGLLTTVALAKEGYRVIATLRDVNRTTRLLDAVRRAGVEAQVEIVQLDITDFSSVDKVVKDTVVKYGRIDVLVNNAGYAAGGFVEEVGMEAWKRQFETNFFGTVAVTRAFLPHMRENRSGTIVNISSISGRIGFPGLGPYVSSKFAVEGFSETLRLEMFPYGVHVVLIEPASYQTDIWAKGLSDAQIPDESPYLKEMQMMVKGIEHISTTASDPQEVVQLISQVLKLKRPRLRYPIGRGVKGTLTLKSTLPWKWVETIVMKRFMK